MIKYYDYVIVILLIGLAIPLLLPIFDKSESDPFGYTIAKLKGINIYINLYHYERHEWPQGLDLQNQLSEYVEEGTMDSFLIDGWGNTIVYVAGSNDQPGKLYSYGKNQKNEYGEGDDILLVITEIEW